ncbi:DUF4169 family protein [Sphingomonas radiodurans]|uniref:DUF4169 family protein n=1 Tax=Sphingomonas radiodurans TaxID=2890321 RepID=UPI001E5456D9|nr:DUF4169 family protein [Sphingomonas radiodurans]WBH17942.1 DUF4169 family protein [Sphingomonas radiodurans]
MGEVINLRRARKARARVDEAAKAGANRVKFGRTKGERDAVSNALTRSERALDGVKRED